MQSSVTNFIYGDCCGICYHLCPKEYADLVLEYGYLGRDSLKRVWVFATPVGSGHNQRVKEDLDREGFEVFRIQLLRSPSAWFPFYKDPVLGRKNYFFTYVDIPRSWWKLVKI